MPIKNQDFIKKLEKTGFTNKEAIIYISVLELGGAYPSRIAEYAGLNRSTTYKILLSLSIRGLINEIEKRNKIYYQIDKPEKVLRHTESRLLQTEDAVEEVKKIMPDLESLFSLLGDKPKVLFFEGPETAAAICNDVISSEGNTELFGISNAEKFKDAMSEAELRDFVKAKERLNITTRGILPDTPGNRQYSETIFDGIRKEIWPKVRFLPKEKFPFEAEIEVYGTNKVSITKLGNQNMIGVIIEDKIIHDMMKMIFELSWNSSEVRE
jgi:sugar-specific transcriptional regulator TrmB